MRLSLAALTCLVTTTTALAAEPPLSADDRAFFERSVRPLLVEKCQSCHSLAHKKKRGGLLLDSRAALLAGGDSGPAIVPGQPAKSLLVQSVRYDHATLQMPPKGKMPPRDIALLEEWVRRGAPFPGRADGPPPVAVDVGRGRSFWSFQPLQTTPPPAARHPARARTRSDVFLLAAMHRHGLTPAPEAERATLFRRLSFDLTGLPPTLEQLDAFVADARPDAYERLVDRLLASPAHGERWGRFWLDLARYCDIAEQWSAQKGAPHLYRDWVVEAFNRDLPYDRFVRLQLAADRIADAAPADRAALGFLGLSPTYWKELKLDPGVIKNVVAEEWEERIGTLGQTFLGLTVACARCHDHKADPISTRDYYALAGIFASIREDDVSVGGPVPARGVVEQSLHVVADGPNRTRLLYKNEPQDVAVQPRGNAAAAGGAAVPRGFLAVLSAGAPAPFRQGSGRLELADALVGDAAPLLARVIVNRVWLHHFGAGIVRTPSDFGAPGERPTHPELLDDLAARFVARGWSLKWLHREIVLSAAYRQTSRVEPGQAARDPENRWLARGPRRRLEVEAWRDALLAVSGGLRLRLGGEAAELSVPAMDRRTLYGVVKRRELTDLLRLHDFPDPTTHSPARLPTTTPLQQLFALNSPLLERQAAALAARLKAEVPGDEAARLRHAYRLLFGRPASAAEVALGRDFLAVAPWEQYAQALLMSNEFLFVD